LSLFIHKKYQPVFVIPISSYVIPLLSASNGVFQPPSHPPLEASWRTRAAAWGESARGWTFFWRRQRDNPGDMGKSWEKHGKNMGKSWEYHGNIMGIWVF